MVLTDRINNKLSNHTFSKCPKFPNKNLLIEVTNYCNNNCIFCYNHCMKRKKKFIDAELCKKVLKEAFELGTREVGFYVTGEPLLDKRLSEFIKYAKDLGYNYIYLTTNGILANIDRVRDLYENGLNSLKFSINAINKKDYEFIHGTDNFNKVIDNLNEINNWKRKNNILIKLYVSYIATDYTCTIEDVKDFFKDKCDEIVIMSAVNQGGLIPDINKTLATNVITNIDNHFKAPCNYPFNSVIVTVEGYLTACCMDFENLLAYANLNEVSLKEAWNNSIITNFREKQLSGDIHETICDNCIYNNKNIPQPLDSVLCGIKPNEDLFCNHVVERCKKFYGSN